MPFYGVFEFSSNHHTIPAIRSIVMHLIFQFSTYDNHILTYIIETMHHAERSCKSWGLSNMLLSLQFLSLCIWDSALKTKTYLDLICFIWQHRSQATICVIM